MSLVGALTHLGQVPRRRVVWLQAVVGYSSAGMASAAFLGALVGSVGGLVTPRLPGAIKATLAGLGLLALVARDSGVINFPVPGWKRQTEKVWANIFGLRTASVMWGLDIGLGLTTWVRYGGFWSLLWVTLLLGDSAYGAGLMTSYWIGRVLPVWLWPFAAGTSWHFLSFMRAISDSERAFRKIGILGLTAILALAPLLFLD